MLECGVWRSPAEKARNMFSGPQMAMEFLQNVIVRFSAITAPHLATMRVEADPDLLRRISTPRGPILNEIFILFYYVVIV